MTLNGRVRDLTQAAFANQLLGGLENDALEIGVCCNNSHLVEIEGVCEFALSRSIFGFDYG